MKVFVVLCMGLALTASAAIEPEKKENTKAAPEDKKHGKRGLFDLGYGYGGFGHFGPSAALFDDSYGHSDEFYPHKTVHVTKTVAVPSPVIVEKPVHVPVKVPVVVEKKVPVVVERPVAVHVDRPVPYAVKVPVLQKIAVPVPKPYPVAVPKPYPVHVSHPVYLEKYSAPIYSHGHGLGLSSPYTHGFGHGLGHYHSYSGFGYHH